MDKFKKELAKAKNPWVKRIGDYLLSRDDLKNNLEKKNKSLDECFEYVLGELAKKAEKQAEYGVGFVSGDDSELYELAIHYYDEDDIKVEKGDQVKQGDLIGKAGNNVYQSSLKKHVHFIVSINDQTVNPNKYFGQKIEKIKTTS